MTTRWEAPAKLTLSLRITGVRDDGYHLLESEMVTLDLADTLEIDDAGTGLDVVGHWPPGADAWRDLSTGPTEDNLVSRALGITGRTAGVRLVKRIPPGAGLGGGSADAAAVLRWAGCTDHAVAARLGADVPFCLTGGRARVAGVGEQVTPLDYEERSFVLLLPPFGVDTAAVYRAWDRLSEGPPTASDAATDQLESDESEPNELESAALAVEPRLQTWARALQEASGQRPRLAGSGSTWFVEGTPAGLGLGTTPWLESGGRRAPLVPVRTTPGAGRGASVTFGTG